MRRRLGVVPWVTHHRSPYRAAFLWRYQWVNRYCAGKDVLDVPCGMGWGTSLISKCKSLTGIDLSAEAIEEANQRYRGTARFLVGDMARLDFPDAAFDVVSCLEGIEHVPQDIGAKFLDEAHRVLRPGGTLLISSPYCRTRPHSGNPYHIHEYRPEEIQQLVSNRFAVDGIVTRDVDIMTVLYISARRK